MELAQKDITGKTINQENILLLDQKQIQINYDTDSLLEERKQGKIGRTIQALFIGPKGQNIQFFTTMIQKAISSHLSARVEYGENDGQFITQKIKNEDSFVDAQERFQKIVDKILLRLKDMSPPLFSSRYFGHMVSQTTIPAMVGNFATMLYNQNNGAFELSALTTLLQIDVMKQFAEMFDYPPMLDLSKAKIVIDQKQQSWGHLTCGGTVANCEAMWAARNCRFMALSIRKYIESIEEDINGIRNIQAKLCNGTSKKLLDLTAWQILNITNESSFELYDLAYKTLYQDNYNNANNYAEYHRGVTKYSISKIGIVNAHKFLDQINFLQPQQEWKHNFNMVPTHKAFVSASAHYSINKSLSILGLGESTLEKIVIDLDSRISIPALNKKLQDCLINKIPVLAVIGVVGTTQEGSIDNLVEISRLKKQLSREGLYFHFHVDGAYGGYFAAMTKDKGPYDYNSYSRYVKKQLQNLRNTDSITFDPHKSGYIPYNCGGIIYRNNRLKDNLSFSAPYVYSGLDPNVAIYGIQGSKSGSSVTSLYTSLQILPLNRKGHGQILQRKQVNCKIFAASLYRIKEFDIEYLYEHETLRQRFDCFVLPRLYSQKINRPDLKQTEMKIINQISKATPTILSSVVKLQPTNSFQDQVYYQLGSDLSIVSYGLNFYDKEARQWNKSLKKFNQFNRTLIQLAKPSRSDINVRLRKLILGEAKVNKQIYGTQIFDEFLKRYNLDADGEQQIVFIRSTIMNLFFTLGISQAVPRIDCTNHVFITELMKYGCQALINLKWR